MIASISWYPIDDKSSYFVSYSAAAMETKSNAKRGAVLPTCHNYELKASNVPFKIKSLSFFYIVFQFLYNEMSCAVALKVYSGGTNGSSKMKLVSK